MKLDSLARLIDAADFMAFRELALECLALKGYGDAALTDGWRDGGTDIRVFELAPNPTPIAFQITVQRDWRAKLQQDAAKVKQELSIEHMTLMTSRRVPEAEFQSEAESVWRDHGVRVTKMDGPAIASAFFLEGKTTRALELLGIELGSEGAGGQNADPRAEAAYSFVFFGEDAHRFRDAAIESAIVAVGAAQEREIDRDDFERKVCDILQMTNVQAPRVSSVVDRLLQRGDLIGPAKSLALSARLADAAAAMRLLREGELNALRDSVARFLQGLGLKKAAVDGSLQAIVSGLGAVLMETGKSSFAALESIDTRSVLEEGARKRLRHLHSTLDSLGVLEGKERDKAVEQLAALASNSPAGRCILAGELFLGLSATRMPGLVRALGARSGVEVLLDSSVAIPMICGLLFQPVDNRFSSAAYHAYSSLRSHSLSMVLPVDYLEESATHLLRAKSDYQEIVDTEPDLVASENAFVSHYVSLKTIGKAPTFAEYLRAFGLDSSLMRADFYAARDALKPRLQALFDRYSIQTIPLVQPSFNARKRAEEAIAYAINEGRVQRPDVLVRHDLRTIAYLHDTDRSGEMAHVLCTWDGVHFWVRERENADWQVLNPAVLGDILSLADTSGAAGRVEAPVFLARTLSEKAAEQGAAVLDRLVEIERGALHDAALLDAARSFKEQYISRLQTGEEMSKLKRAWAEWKSRNYARA